MPFPSSSGGTVSTLTNTISQTAHGFIIKDAVYWNGTAYAKGRADSPSTSEILGIVSAVVNANSFILTTSGNLTGLTGLTSGEVYWLSDVTAGLATITQPTVVSSVSKPLFVATSATTAQIQIFDTAPAQGQTSVVEYLNIVTNAIQTVTGNSTVNTAAAAVTFLTPTVVGNIPVNTTTGKITLSAGKTYTLLAKVPSATTGVVFQWVNATLGTFIGERWDSSTGSSALNGNSPIVVITPTTTTDVFVQSVFAASSALGVNDVNGLRGVSVHIEQIGASPVPMDLVGEYGTQAISANVLTGAINTPIDVLSFTLPSAGTWRVWGQFSGITSANCTSEIWLTDNANNILPGSMVIAPGISGNGIAIPIVTTITTTGTTVFKVRTQTNAGVFTIYSDPASINSTGLPATPNSSKIVWQKISGFIPSSGQTVDYVQVQKTTVQNVVTGNPILFDIPLNGNIPYNPITGQFTLNADKTYRLQSNVAPNQAGVGLTTVWVNVTAGNTNIAGSLGRNYAMANAGSIGSTNSDIIFTPAVTTLVQLNNVTGSTVTISAGTGLTEASYATITQIGSSAVISNIGANTMQASVISVQSIPSNIDTILTNWTSNIDTSGSFVPSTGIYTIPANGYYLVTGNAGISGSAATVASRRLHLMNSAKTISYASFYGQNSATTAWAATVSGLLKFNAGDTICLVITQFDVASQNTLASATAIQNFGVTFMHN